MKERNVHGSSCMCASCLSIRGLHPLKGKTCSEETKHKISLTKLGEKNPMFGVSVSDERRKRMSESMSGEKNPFYGKHHTEEALEKIKQSSIERRYSKETNKKRSLSISEWWKKQPNWRGGEYERYPRIFFKMRDEIRERDNYVCQVCKTTENGKKHVTHHIDYNLKNSKEENLICVCNFCHGKTNGSRRIWQEVLEEYQRCRFGEIR